MDFDVAVSRAVGKQILVYVFVTWLIFAGFGLILAAEKFVVRHEGDICDHEIVVSIVGIHDF